MGMSCKNTINKEKDADPKLLREKTFIFRGFRTIYESFFYKSLRTLRVCGCVACATYMYIIIGSEPSFLCKILVLY